MMDLVYGGVITVLFFFGIGLVMLCDRLKQG